MNQPKCNLTQVKMESHFEGFDGKFQNKLTI